MDEITRIKKLVTDHFDGNPWLDVNVMDTLNNISASDAAKKINNVNSIWEIANHLTKWREALCKKIKGEMISVPQSNFFEEINDKSEKEWKAAKKKLELSQKNILEFLKSVKDVDFEKVFTNGHTSYEHFHAIVHHDAYHLGQIVILSKLVKV